MIINNKLKMYKLLMKGEFGNTALHTTVSKLNLVDKKRINNIRLRYAGGPGSRYRPFTNKSFPINLTNKYINQWIKKGFDKNRIIISQAIADKERILQGELTLYLNGYELLYTLEPGDMRTALKKSKRATGLKAKMILEKFIDPSSMEDLIFLLNKYPNHVIEFTVLKSETGTIPNRNTIIWEVRNY